MTHAKCVAARTHAKYAFSPDKKSKSVYPAQSVHSAQLTFKECVSCPKCAFSPVKYQRVCLSCPKCAFGPVKNQKSVYPAQSVHSAQLKIKECVSCPKCAFSPVKYQSKIKECVPCPKCICCPVVHRCRGAARRTGSSFEIGQDCPTGGVLPPSAVCNPPPSPKKLIAVTVYGFMI